MHPPRRRRRRRRRRTNATAAARPAAARCRRRVAAGCRASRQRPRSARPEYPPQRPLKGVRSSVASAACAQRHVPVDRESIVAERHMRQDAVLADSATVSPSGRIQSRCPSIESPCRDRLAVVALHAPAGRVPLLPEVVAVDELHHEPQPSLPRMVGRLDLGEHDAAWGGERVDMRLAGMVPLIGPPAVPGDDLQCHLRPLSPCRRRSPGATVARLARSGVSPR